MKPFEIVAHRGVHDIYPENTLFAFERAIELGADSVELDIRLSSDHIPMVFHYFYLDEITSTNGTIFNYTYEQLKNVEIIDKNNKNKPRISTLSEILDSIGGRIGLEIEIKGPEPESVKVIADVLSNYKSIWSSIEVTSYEPLLLCELQKLCRDIPTDLLFPPSEAWMKLDVVTYMAIHRSRLANARAVHLHPTQLTSEVVDKVRKNNIEIHTWDVNDDKSLKTCADLEVTKICTDKFQQAKIFRQSFMMAS